MDVGPPLVLAHLEAPPVAVKPRQCPLDHPPVVGASASRPTRRRASRCASRRRASSCAEPCGSAGSSRVALVRVQLLGALPRPAYRPDRVHEFLEHLRVVDVGGGERYRERDAVSVDHKKKKALRAPFATMRRVGAGVLVPPGAGTAAESSEARSQSMRSASPKLSSSAPGAGAPTPRPRATPGASCVSRRSRRRRSPSPEGASPRGCPSSARTAGCR